jgi:hypothetical protein
MHPDERKDTTHTQEAANSRLISPEDPAGYCQVTAKPATNEVLLPSSTTYDLQMSYFLMRARQDSNLRPAD